MSLSLIRNIGIIAHIDAGKTTLTERFLYYTGFLHKMGEVHDGNTFMDWMEPERERGITISSAVTTCYWENPEIGRGRRQDYRINIIDTPGHVDFTAEVERSLRVLDGAIGVFCAVAGVEPQSETVWHQADRYKVPRIAFINKMDRLGADFESSVEMIRERLTKNAIPIVIPMGKEDGFEGVIDLIEMRAYYFDKPTYGSKYYDEEIPEKYIGYATHRREELIEILSENDEELLTLFVEGKPIDNRKIMLSCRELTINNSIVPILCGSALRNTGVQLLLNAICQYLPSPSEVIPASGKDAKTGKTVYLHPTKKVPQSTRFPSDFAALVFKVQIESQIGKMLYIRVYTGSIKKGDIVINQTNNKREKITRILQMYSNKKEELTTLSAGDIGAIVGPKLSITGDTLTKKENDIYLESIDFPDPVIAMAIEPKTKADQDALNDALSRMQEQDPTFHVNQDKETGQTLISGMGELHLDVIVDRLEKEFKVRANVGSRKVYYKETISKTVEVEGDFIRNLEGKGHFAIVKLRISPYYPEEQEVVTKSEGKETAKNKFSVAITEDVLPASYWKAVEEGVMNALNDGPQLGCPVEQVKVELIDGQYNELITKEVDFIFAASVAVGRALAMAGPRILEPIMLVNVITPEDYVGDLIGDLNAKRGKIVDIIDTQKRKTIVAEVPMGELFGYSTTVRNLSKGMAIFTMEFLKYDRASKSIQDSLLKGITGNHSGY